MNRSVEFFAAQFERQIAGHDYALNPFETRALPYARGALLELGCGLGNLALAAARSGATVTALDACPHAISDLARRAREEGLPVHAAAVDLATWRAQGSWDTVVAIGLLMFFDCGTGWRVLDELQRATRPGGVLVVNVLVRGTTFMAMFDADRHCLFDPDELRGRFAGWQVLEDAVEDFPAGEGALKRFVTLIARRSPEVQ